MLVLTIQNHKFIYLCFFIWNHGNHGNLFLFKSYECQEIQIKNHLISILGLSFKLESEQLLHQKETMLQLKTFQKDSYIKNI
jgi:hypothetical protein